MRKEKKRFVCLLNNAKDHSTFIPITAGNRALKNATIDRNIPTIAAGLPTSSCKLGILIPILPAAEDALSQCSGWMPVLLPTFSVAAARTSGAKLCIHLSGSFSINFVRKLGSLEYVCCSCWLPFLSRVSRSRYAVGTPFNKSVRTSLNLRRSSCVSSLMEKARLLTAARLSRSRISVISAVSRCASLLVAVSVTGGDLSCVFFGGIVRRLYQKTNDLIQHTAGLFT